MEEKNNVFYIVSISEIQFKFYICENIIQKFDILLISKFLKLVANFRASRAIVTNYFNPW